VSKSTAKFGAKFADPDSNLTVIRNQFQTRQTAHMVTYTLSTEGSQNNRLGTRLAFWS